VEFAGGVLSRERFGAHLIPLYLLSLRPQESLANTSCPRSVGVPAALKLDEGSFWKEWSDAGGGRDVTMGVTSHRC